MAAIEPSLVLTSPSSRSPARTNSFYPVPRVVGKLRNRRILPGRLGHSASRYKARIHCDDRDPGQQLRQPDGALNKIGRCRRRSGELGSGWRNSRRGRATHGRRSAGGRAIRPGLEHRVLTGVYLPGTIPLYSTAGESGHAAASAVLWGRACVLALVSDCPHGVSVDSGPNAPGSATPTPFASFIHSAPRAPAEKSFHEHVTQKTSCVPVSSLAASPFRVPESAIMWS